MADNAKPLFHITNGSSNRCYGPNCPDRTGQSREKVYFHELVKGTIPREWLAGGGDTWLCPTCTIEFLKLMRGGGRGFDALPLVEIGCSNDEPEYEFDDDGTVRITR